MLYYIEKIIVPYVAAVRGQLEDTEAAVLVI